MGPRTREPLAREQSPLDCRCGRELPPWLVCLRSQKGRNRFQGSFLEESELGNKKVSLTELVSLRESGNAISVASKEFRRRKLRDRKPGLFNAFAIFDHTGFETKSEAFA